LPAANGTRPFGRSYPWVRVKAGPSYLALLLAALALVACGGDEDSASESSATTRDASEQEGNRSDTNQAGTTGTEDARRKRTGNRAQRPKRKSRVGRSDTGPAAPAGPTTPKERPKQEESGSPQLTSDPQELKRVARELSRQARTVCKAYGTKLLAKDLRSRSRKPDDLAEEYAASYHVDIREAVAAGCKAGLLASKR
jgi:hypothetical protein